MSSFKDFITNNGILATTAGITIGFATASFVKSFVADVILPIIFLMLVKGTGKVSTTTSSFFGKFLSNKEFMFANFMSELVTWISIVLIAWLVLSIVHKYIVSKEITMPVMHGNPFGPRPTVTQEEHYRGSVSAETAANRKEQYRGGGSVSAETAANRAKQPWEPYMDLGLDSVQSKVKSVLGMEPYMDLGLDSVQSKVKSVFSF
jgi:large-conductance mechanosensitive channel